MYVYEYIYMYIHIGNIDTVCACVCAHTRFVRGVFFSYMIVQQPNLQPNSPLALDNMLLAGSPRASRFSLISWSASFIFSSTTELTCVQR